MRIALLSKWLARESDRFGSEGGFVQQAAEALLDRGHEVIALSQEKGAGRGTCRQIGRLPVHLFDAEKRQPALSLADKLAKSFTGHRKILTDAIEIRHFLQTQGPFQAIWAQAEDPDGTACGMASRLGPMPPFLITVQAVRWAEQEWRELRFTHQWNLGLGFSRAARVAANSPLSARWMEVVYGVPKTKLGFYRVNLTRLFLTAAATARLTPPLTEPSPRILFFGALNATKAPDVFLEAVQRLAPRHPDWQFVVAGGETGADRHFASRLAQLRTGPELAERVVFTGALSETRVIEEIARASVVVCPSRIDTLSRATVEALVLGKPVVVAENVGARALVEEHAAGVVTRCEPVSLAEGIDQVLGDPGYAERARAAAEAVARDHSPEAAAASLEIELARAAGLPPRDS